MGYVEVDLELSSRLVEHEAIIHSCMNGTFHFRRTDPARKISLLTRWPTDESDEYLLGLRGIGLSA